MRETRENARRSQPVLRVPGVDASVEVRRHPSARRMTLRVSNTHRAVILTIPSRCDLSAADKFVSRHADWLKQKLGAIPVSIPFADGSVIPLRGTPHRVVAEGLSRGGVVSTTEDEIRGPALHVAGEPEHLARRLTDWLVEQARRDLDGRVRFHAQRLAVRAKRITVRDQLSRWGSCSTTGALSFSWRLIMAPPLVLDYVAAHEVAHLREMNHGKKFWALVRETMPDMDQARAWLHANGTDLHRYGATN